MFLSRLTNIWMIPRTQFRRYVTRWRWANPSFIWNSKPWPAWLQTVIFLIIGWRPLHWCYKSIPICRLLRLAVGVVSTHLIISVNASKDNTESLRNSIRRSSQRNNIFPQLFLYFYSEILFNQLRLKSSLITLIFSFINL